MAENQKSGKEIDNVEAKQTRLLFPGAASLDKAPQPAQESSGTSSLVQLWEDAVAQFRRTTPLNSSEETWLLENPLTTDKQIQAILVQWEKFRSGPKNAVTKSISLVLRTLQANIESLDAMIGYPTQAVDPLLASWIPCSSTDS